MVARSSCCNCQWLPSYWRSFICKDFDLRAQGEAFGVVVEVVVGHAQAVLAEGLVATGADAGLPGARLVAVFRQAGRGDLQVGRRVLVDRAQQFEAALGACGVAFQAIGAVAAQAIGGVDDQGLALAGQGFERRVSAVASGHR